MLCEITESPSQSLLTTNWSFSGFKVIPSPVTLCCTIPLRWTTPLCSRVLENLCIKGDEITLKRYDEKALCQDIGSGSFVWSASGNGEVVMDIKFHESFFCILGLLCVRMITALIAWFMGPTWGPPGADRTQVGPMLALWTLLSGWLLDGGRLMWNFNVFLLLFCCRVVGMSKQPIYQTLDNWHMILLLIRHYWNDELWELCVVNP